MSVKKWLLLPFDSASARPRHNGGGGNKESNGEGVQNGVLSKHESKKAFADKGEEEVVADYNAPIRWWVQATLFPLIAGTFGPMASAFNICAVAIPWRLIVAPDSTEAEGQHINDPTWIVAVNAVSLAVAIIANLALLGQMTGRLRFNLAAPVVIVGWYISGLVDIALVAAAPGHLPLPPNALATYSQAYYYAIFAGAIYVILSIMLSLTAYGVWYGGYSSEFKLSLSQRSLMLQTILFLSYVLAAGGVFSRIENWTYLDSVYFVVVTLFTIGFGDLTPKTHLGRSLFIPFAVGGILFVGLIIANIRTLVLESGSKKISTRMVEKARFKALKSGSPDDGVVKLRGIKKREINGETELERREQEFHIMREVQVQAAHDNRIFALTFSAAAFLLLWFVGAAAFWQAEQAVGGQNWSYFEALYFTYVAQLTIGYGDFEPQTNSAKPAFVFWALIALPTLTVLIGAIGDAVSDFVNWGIVWLPKHTPNAVKALRHFGQSDDKRKATAQAVRQAEEALADQERNEGFHDLAEVEAGEVLPRGLDAEKLDDEQMQSARDAYRPFLMLKAAQKIIKHLDADPPRKYNYTEWTWLLRLLGEDESSEDGHRRAGQPVEEGVEVAEPLRNGDNQVWSWMGQESPLMSLEEDSEPKWVLKRLMQVLEQDLKRRGDKRLKKEGVQPATSLTASLAGFMHSSSQH